MTRAAGQVGLTPVCLEGASVRKAISPAKTPMLEAVKYVLTTVLGPYLPVSLRKIHYELLNLPVLRHANKPDSQYRNTKNDYKDLSDLVTRARLAGHIPWAWLEDETRPCTLWNTWATPQAFVQAQLDRFLTGYWRDLLQSQPHHVEILCEKNTVHQIILSVVAAYCLPLTSGRGFSDVGHYYDLFQRYQASQKDRLILLLVTDFDPEGEEIVQVAGRTMQRDFGVERLDVYKVTLTHAQVQALPLPPALDAKTTSSNYRKFVRKYGTNVHELEALAPPVQRALLREVIEQVLDMTAFAAEQAREEADTAALAALRTRVVDRIQTDLGTRSP
jgi:hypothetical protein